MSSLPLMLLALAFALSGCSLLQRSPRSGYGPGSADAPARHGVETGDLGSDDVENIEKKRYIRQLESRLQSPREREQYSKVLPWLDNDDEKIEYLSLGSMDARAQWVKSKEIWKRPQEMQLKAKEIVEAGDIAVGMTAENVRKAWGEPQSIDASGNPLYRNERWKYARQVPSQDGYRQERRYVYFEGGRVVGWETE